MSEFEVSRHRGRGADRRNRCQGRRVAGLAVALLLLAACGTSLPSNDRLLESFEAGRTGIWVSGHGKVTQILGDEPGLDPKQRLMLRVDDQLNLMLVHSMSRTGRIPVERGQIVSFHGRYEWNASGGAVSLTHRDEAQPGDGGWIELAGTRYD